MYNNGTVFLDDAAYFLSIGIDIIQVKFSKKNDIDMVIEGKKLKELTLHFGALLILEKRADIAKIIGADGVFLGESDMTPSNARDILGHDLFIVSDYFDDVDFLLSDGKKNGNLPTFYKTKKKIKKCSIFTKEK